MRIFLLTILSLVSMGLFAQDLTVTGVITTADTNETAIGATIMIKGTSKGTVTDFDGRYELPNVPSDAVLVYSTVGMKTQEIPVDGRTVINVVLQSDVELIDEVVVVGYGVVKKSDLTSSITTVKGEDINQTISGNAVASLQGKANGVQVTGTGAPGSTPRVIIRGVSTVNGSDPLYVVDGMPVGTNINFLNQEDIESMEVLKDASASAIYGTRGSNGVILITTKKGKAGKTQFQFNSSVGFQTISAPTMAGASEYEKVIKARYINDGSTPVWNGKDNITDAEGTNWWNVIIKNPAIVQSHNLSFQGGNDKITYSASLGYFQQNSNYEVGNWDKLNSRFNMEYKFNKYVKSGVDLMIKRESWEDTPDLFHATLRMDPTTPIYKPQEMWTDNPLDNYARSNNNQIWNPAAEIARQNSSSTEYGMMLNPYLSIEPIKNLTLRTQFGTNALFRLSDSFTPKFYIDNLEQNANSHVERTFNHWIDWNWTNTINYNTTIASKHNINVMAGYTMEKFANYWLTGSRENTPSNYEDLQHVSAGTMNEKASGTNAYNTLVSVLGRVMYNYDNKYYVTATARTDGSSRFPKGNKFATFPSVSLAWRMSEEGFMKNQDVISNLKIRAGWGRVGNQNIDNSSFLSLIGNADYVFGGDRVLGTAVSTIGNTRLCWETVEDYNVGVDVSFLNNRLSVVADWFRKESRDMLLQSDNLGILGYPMWNGQMWANVGSMRAQGWELSLNWNDQVGDFSYGIGLNLSSVKNTALKLLGDSPIYAGEFHGDYIIRNMEGQEISQFYGYVADGLFQNQTEINSHTSEQGDKLQPDAVPGDIRFKDINNDGILDDKDKTVIGSAFPDLMIGLNTNFSYKNFDLVANFYGTIGNDIYNTTKDMYSGINNENVIAGTYDKVWNGEGSTNSIPRLSANDLNGNYKRVSSFFVEDGSYFRCKLLQIGYTIPKKVLKVTDLRISVSAQNLFTITKYSGLDPEQAAMGSVISSGLDYLGYPNPRSFLVGLNLKF